MFYPQHITGIETILQFLNMFCHYRNLATNFHKVKEEKTKFLHLRAQRNVRVVLRLNCFHQMMIIKAVLLELLEQEYLGEILCLFVLLIAINLFKSRNLNQNESFHFSLFMQLQLLSYFNILFYSKKAPVLVQLSFNLQPNKKCIRYLGFVLQSVGRRRYKQWLL